MIISRLRIALLSLILPTLGVGCTDTLSHEDVASLPPLQYVVDLIDRTDDEFDVTLAVDDLGPDNAIYQFASTAPGTYQTMDLGRFVRSFEAVRADGSVIPSEQISTNQWRISEPEDVAEIRYELAETWDTPVDEYPIYLMAGTSIEEDHALINGQAVFGYPTGMQARPMKIRIEYPDAWSVGTALSTDEEGFYLADNYDHAVDSPILLGRLSHAALDIRGAAVEVFTYSKTDKVHSEDIAESVADILDAAGQFLVELPVDRYVLLFHYEDVSAGAWEHSYSSEYVFAEPTELGETMEGVRSIVAHEFFHIVTPLNIHSEIVEYFNFVEPVASEHIWLYEGTTEWMAHASQLRAELIDLDTYLARLSQKLNSDDHFDKSYSLSQLGLESHTPKGQQEWGNIYQRGAIVAGLIDLMLLDNSGGKRGLREELIELSKTYGPDRPFDEATFFDDFAERTYAGVRPFFDDHVRGTKTLPIAEYFEKVGILYEPEVNTGQQVVSFGIGINVSGQTLIISQVDDIASGCGLEAGDAFVGFNGAEVNLATANEVLGQFSGLGADEDFTVTVERDDERREYTCAKRLTDQVLRHIFTVDSNASPEQVALREAWTRNLSPVSLPTG